MVRVVRGVWCRIPWPDPNSPLDLDSRIKPVVTDLASPTADQLEISCQSCGATISLEPHLRTATCPFCASPSIVERPPLPDRPSPTFVIGFAIDHERAVAAVRRWVAGSHAFARSDFKRAVPELTRGVYLPAYLYGAVANSDYSASIGENYTETETYTTTGADGKTVTRTRTVTRTEWRPLSGRHTCYMIDVIVTASRGVGNDALQEIEPFDLRALRRYAPSFISGWIAEEPSRGRQECLQYANQESLQNVGRMLNGFMPGDSFSNLQYQTRLSQEVIELVLLPVWTFALRYADDRPPLQILVNGQTGRVGGKVPVSAVKVTAAVLVALAIVGVLILLILFASQG